MKAIAGKNVRDARQLRGLVYASPACGRRSCAIWSRCRDEQPDLTAGHAHVAGQCRPVVPAINHEIMSFRFARDCLVNCGMQKLVAFRSAQRIAEIGGVILAEAHVQRAGAGNAHAITRFTEVMGKWRNKAQPPAGFLYTYIAGRPSRTIVDVLERKSLRQSRPHDR